VGNDANTSAEAAPEPEPKLPERTDALASPEKPATKTPGPTLPSGGQSGQVDRSAKENPAPESPAGSDLSSRRAGGRAQTLVVDDQPVVAKHGNGSTESLAVDSATATTPAAPPPSTAAATHSATETGPAAADGDRGATASLLASGALILGVGSALTVIVFISPAQQLQRCASTSCGNWEFWQDWGNYVAVGIGVAAAIILAVAIGTGRALTGRNNTLPERANPRQFGVLSEKWSSLDARRGRLCQPIRNPDGSPATVAQEIACEEVRVHCDYVAAELGIGGERRHRSGAKWVLGSGFIDIWNRLHEAECAFFVLEPTEEVVADAFRDEARLVGSNIDNSDDLLRKLRAAAATLGGKRYLSSDAAALLQNTDADDSPQAQTEARLILRDVREAISEFRDQRREGLTQARNQLMLTGLVTGIVAYAMLALAILVGANRTGVIAAVAFFLMGAVVGLFAQLRSWSSGQGGGEDDFGLAKARLLYAPLLSGLAGVGGVLITTMLYASINGSIILGGAAANQPPTMTVTSSPNGTAPRETPHLTEIFDLSEDRFGLVLAAIFGLTPELLINRLQGQADKYKVDLQSTSVQTRST
jgi:hypothetical protein